MTHVTHVTHAAKTVKQLLAFRSALKEPLRDVRTDLVVQPTFAGSIKTWLQSDQYGVFVVWAPPRSGKTTCIHAAAAEWLQAPTLHSHAFHRHVRFIQSYNVQAPEELLRDHLHISSCDALAARLADLDYELVLVLDQFDKAFTSDKEQRHAIKRFVRSLAAMSKNTQRFRVVLGLTNPGLAKTVLCWNAGKKIHLCGDANNITKFKWGEAEARQIVPSGWSDEDKQAFIQAACKSGNVETIMQLKHDRMLLLDAAFQQVVEADGKAWETGAALIHSRLTHPTPED